MSRFKSALALRSAVVSVARNIFTMPTSPSLPLRRREASLEALELRQYLTRPLGIDVSHYQGSVNWTSVHNAGKTFAYVKATEGVGVTDAYLTSNMTNGKAAGLIMGVYEHATPASTANDAVNEANYFVSVAGNYLTAGYLRPAVDISGNTSLDATGLTNWVNSFISTVKTATGVEPLIYGNNTNVNGVTSAATTHNLWIARWSSQYGDATTTGSPPTGQWASGTWSFWQYSNTASVSGVTGAVDLDSFNGTAAQLQSYVIAPGISISGASSAVEASTYTLTLGRSGINASSINSWTINWATEIRRP